MPTSMSAPVSAETGDVQVAALLGKGTIVRMENRLDLAVPAPDFVGGNVSEWDRRGRSRRILGADGWR